MFLISNFSDELIESKCYTILGIAMDLFPDKVHHECLKVYELNAEGGATEKIIDEIVQEILDKNCTEDEQDLIMSSIHRFEEAIEPEILRIKHIEDSRITLEGNLVVRLRSKLDLQSKYEAKVIIIPKGKYIPMMSTVFRYLISYEYLKLKDDLVIIVDFI